MIKVSFVKCFLKSNYIFFLKNSRYRWQFMFNQYLGYLGYHAIHWSLKLYTPIKNKKMLVCKFICTVFFYNLQLLDTGIFCYILYD